MLVRWTLTLSAISIWASLAVLLDVQQPWITVVSILLGFACWYFFDPLMQRTGR